MTIGKGVEGLRFDGVDLDQVQRVADSEETRTLDIDIAEAPQHEISFQDLRPSDVIILRQTRITYEDQTLNDLAHSMDAIGQTSPTNVAWLRSQETAQRYIDEINRSKGTDYRLGEFPVLPNEDGTYYVVIAGHQRTLGNVIKNLRRSGGDRDVDARTMPCLVYADISFEDASDLQTAENACRQNPPIWEEASAWAMKYKERRSKGQIASITEYARTIGISDDKLRNAIRFTELPPQVQAFVMGDHVVFEQYPDRFTPLDYRAAVELWKLREHLVETELTQVALTAMDGEWTYKKTVAEVDKYAKTHQLPEKVRQFIADADISIDVAPHLFRLVGLYGEEAIISLAYDYDTNEWDTNELSKRVDRMVNDAEVQQFSLLMEEPEELLAMKRADRARRETSRLTRLTREMERVLRVWDGEHLPGMGEVALKDEVVLETIDHFMEMLTEVARRKNGEVPPAVRERIFGLHALIAANRTGLSPGEVSAISGVTPSLEPIEREFTPAAPPARKLF